MVNQKKSQKPSMASPLGWPGTALRSRDRVDATAVAGGPASPDPGERSARFGTLLAQRGVRRLDQLGDQREAFVEGQERRLHRVDGEPLQVAQVVAERLD